MDMYRRKIRRSRKRSGLAEGRDRVRRKALPVADAPGEVRRAGAASVSRRRLHPKGQPYAGPG